MNPRPKHPSLYEINTRVLLNSLGRGSTLADIPGKYWKDLQERGISWVWLMGVWEIQEKALDPNLIPAGMMQEFHTLMPDLTDHDICGSPYAIHDYVIDPTIGSEKQLKDIRKKLHKLGIRLMLDFVPNHFGAHCRWLDAHRAFFVQASEKDIAENGKTYYQPWHERPVFFAHGKDPYFDAWQDTVQVNYANPATHVWMTGILEQIADVCDGVRCDMAMLPVNRIFTQTWKHLAIEAGQPEFWPAAISAVRKRHPEFLFLAECYWDMEAELMQMGFDYCYDKVFYDRMLMEDGDRMRLHFHAEPWWLDRTARFLENHDETRASTHLHLQKHMATAALVAFGPGMRFWHMGQWDGRRKRIPVQLHRQPDEGVCGCLLSVKSPEVICSCVDQFYTRLLQVARQPIFREGNWRVVYELPAVTGLIYWLWNHHHLQVLVAINYANTEVAFSLADVLHLLHLKNPRSLLSNREPVDPHQVHLLAPWSVHVWEMDSI